MLKIDELAGEYTLNTPIHTKNRSMDWANARTRTREIPVIQD